MVLSLVTCYSTRDFEQPLDQGEGVVRRRRWIKADGRRRVNQVRDADVAQSLDVFFDLCERAHHRMALGGGLLEDHREGAKDDFHWRASGACRGFVELLDHAFEPFE